MLDSIKKIFTKDEVKTQLADGTIVLKEGVGRKIKTQETNEVTAKISDGLINNLRRDEYGYWRRGTGKTGYISTTQRKTD